MTQVSVTHPLVERFARLRGRVRMVVGLFGIGVVIAAAVGAMLLLMFGDYLIHFSAAMRVVLLLGWLVGLGILTWRVLLAPLSTRLTDQFLARQVETLHKDLADELISAMHFIDRGTIQTNALAARHVESAVRKTEGMRFDEAIDFRRSAKAAGIAALLVTASVLIGIVNPSMTKIALSRWFSGSPLDWPRVTRVRFVWVDSNGKAPSVVPIGEQLRVRAEVVQGGYPDQHVWLTTWTDKHRAVDELMTYQPTMSHNGVFVYERVLEPGSGDGETKFSLRLQAGDDTEQDPVELRLAPRPVIGELSAMIVPPPYVKNANDPTKPADGVSVDLLSQAGHAVEGSGITLRIQANKPFAVENDGAPLVSLRDQNTDKQLTLALAKKLGDSPNAAEVSFKANETLQARIDMHDVDGFENRVGGAMTIGVVPDALPSVIITDPRRIVERSPTAVVELTIEGTDDLGLDGLKLRAEKFDAKPNDPPVFEAPLAWNERIADKASGNTTGKAKYVWDLTPLNLQPGTRLSFYTMVQDNYEVNGQRHPWVKSATLTLQIRSEAEIEEAKRRDLNEVKERIKLLKGQQEQTRSMTDAIQKAIAMSGVTTPQQKDQLSQLAQQESQQAAAANAIEQKVEQISDDLRQNKLATSELGKLSDEVAAGMKDVGQNNMPKAASDLNKAHEAAGNTDKRNDQSKEQAKQAADAATSASTSQGQAVATMDRLIDRLGAAGDFETARAELHKIKDKQDELEKRTQALMAKTFGSKPEDLPQNLKDELSQLANDQKDLGTRTNELIQKMEKAASQLQQNDPAASESLTNAAKAGNDNQVSSAQGNAGASISQNKSNDASDNQGQAQRGLQKMIDELDKNDRRQLEQLSRQLLALIQELKKIKEAEELLNKDSVTAGEKAAEPEMIKLGDRQGMLQQNTIVVQKKAESTKSAQKAAVDIGEASDHMAAAAGALYSVKQPASLDPEVKAIAALDEAIKKLEKEKEKVDSQLKEKDLADFIQQYESIKKDQTIVKTSSDAIEVRRAATADHQVDRLGTHDLIGMSITQGKLIEQVNALSNDDKLKAYAVVVWMNGQVVEAMDISSEHMKRAATGRQLAVAQQTAIDRLTDIIEALKEEKQREAQFQSPQGGGGGGKPPLVPPLAQLKLLKAMQLVINAQTVSVNKDIDAAKDAAEKQELQDQAAKLGKKQGEIKDIASKLLESLKH